MLGPQREPESEADAPDEVYRYARVVGIYHTFVRHNSANPLFPGNKKIDFLRVRWYRDDTKQIEYGVAAKRLQRLCFYPEGDTNAYGFVNPDDVIRGAHIIPAFAYGRVAASEAEWKYYYAMP